MSLKKRKNIYKETAHCKYLCQYHIIWCPKYRFNVLKGDIVEELKNKIFKEIEERYKYEILEQEIMEDHIHLFVGVKPSVAPLDIVRTFKSISGIELFKRFPNLKIFYGKCGSMWSNGKFISSIGEISEGTVRKYIKEQKNK
jgi:putative transposase